MDKTLRSYLQQADESLEYLEKYYIGLTASNIEEKIIELQSSIKTLQAISYRLADVSNIATRALHRKKKNVETKHIDPYPSSYDFGTLSSLNPVESKELVKGISIPVTTVETLADIPKSHLYYVKSIDQYAVNIDGIYIRGGLGNIVEYQTKNSTKCEYGKDCKSFKSGATCGYFHDPEDYIFHGKPVPAIERNYTVGSWIYSRTKTPKTYFTRHIGSKDRILYDLSTLRRVQYREEISNREGQLIHDLLIYMILNTKGLLERHTIWKKMPRAI